ncbi:hypothetical protein CTI12_AA184820 [Artemisia annua]|uniref:Uncharacterized protein n=1 Tax=Artemisia annua TaxID=35608 RepID=A0A2U1P7S6_ARTAN|nr:hypothetical protein CTI12_AA184820 [Artemisia annua]
MTKDDSVKTNKRKNVRRGNGISIRENEHPLSPNSESDSDSEENIDKYDNIVSDTDTDESDRSFDYMSDCEDEVIELRKRKFDYRKGAVEVGEENESTETDKDVEGNGDLNGFGSNPLVRQHEKYMEALMRKIKGNGVGITDPFTMVEKSKERYPIYDDLTHWKLKKPKVLLIFIVFGLLFT